MSDTEIIAPPPDKFRLDAAGMQLWKACFDRIHVDRLIDGTRNLRVTKDDTLVFQRLLTTEEAAHLARLLTD